MLKLIPSTESVFGNIAVEVSVDALALNPVK